MSRHNARVETMKVLYQADLLSVTPEEVLRCYRPELDPEDNSFFLSLLDNIWLKSNVINQTIEKISMEWRMDRMAIIDRNIMRMAVYEMVYCEDIPLSVAIDEAVEIAKTYAGAESAKFINGVVGEIAKTPAAFSDIAAQKPR